MPTPFAIKLAEIATAQFDKFHLQHEHDPELFKAIKKWHKDIGFGDDFDPITTPWSAVFVSWCVFAAGADSNEFKFSTAHSIFVRQAIKNADTGVGVFRAFPIDKIAPQVGDIIQFNRGKKPVDYDFARTHSSYPSHSAIVVKTGLEDEQGPFLFTIGGNEGDSVRMTKVRLTASGKVRQRTLSPYICVVQTLK